MNKNKGGRFLGGYGGEVEEPGGEVVNLGSGGGYNLGWGGCRFLGGFWVGFWVGFTCVLGVLTSQIRRDAVLSKSYGRGYELVRGMMMNLPRG